MSKREIVAQLMRDPYVIEYQKKDNEFAELVKHITASGHDWESREILIGNRKILAKELGKVYQKRLALLYQLGNNISENEQIQEIRKSMENLLSFCNQFPQSYIQGIFLKSSTASYTVFLSHLEKHVKVISIIRGGKIPDILWGQI